MRRKVIQIADSTQLISLPRKWALKHGIKKGDELEIEARTDSIIVRTEKGVELEEVELDVTDLDRTSIMFAIRSLYRRGYDTITINFSKQSTTHLRTKNPVRITSVIHEEVNRLSGVEIVKQAENSCVIQGISEISAKELDTIIRRVFRLLLDASQDFVKAVKGNDVLLLGTIEEKHDTITKFVSYCLRILNKKGIQKQETATLMYHIISSLDLIVDVIKYSSRDFSSYSVKPSKHTIEVLESIDRSLQIFYDYFYDFSITKLHQLSSQKEIIKSLLKDSLPKLSSQEVLLLANMRIISDVLRDVAEARMSIEY